MLRLVAIFLAGVVSAYVLTFLALLAFIAWDRRR
jgi:hypothetical protein